MPDLIDLLDKFNRKERFFLVRQALGAEEGAKGFLLAESFRTKLGEAIGTEIPADALAWMDYHLDWIAASLWAAGKSDLLCKPISSSDQAFTGTQQDIDLLVAFNREGRCHLVLLEAKGYDSWSNSQLCKKSKRLEAIFGANGDRHSKVQPYFCLISPTESKQLKTEGWPASMKGEDGKPRCMKLDVEYPRYWVTGCDSDGNSSDERSHFRIKKIKNPAALQHPTLHRSLDR